MTLYVGSREEQRFLKILDQKLDERLSAFEERLRQLEQRVETLATRKKARAS